MFLTRSLGHCELVRQSQNRREGALRFRGRTVPLATALVREPALYRQDKEIW